MSFEGTTYRPPLEANALLLQVTVGCAHNSCTFCNMYRDVAFRVSSLKEIEADLIEARSNHRQVRRAFLVNGDAFVLNARKLKAIAAKIIEYFPECEHIAMFASIQSIARKTDGALRELSNFGIDDLYIGLETGYGEVVQAVNKGFSIEQAKIQLQRLNHAGMRYGALLMLGIAGKGEGLTNARETANLLNNTKPSLVWVGTLSVLEGTELFEDVQKGKFTLATERELLLEEKALIEHLELENVPFYGVHPTNMAYIVGVLPDDKKEMTAQIEQVLIETEPVVLDSSIPRTQL